MEKWIEELPMAIEVHLSPVDHVDQEIGITTEIILTIRKKLSNNQRCHVEARSFYLESLLHILKTEQEHLVALRMFRLQLLSQED